MCGGFSKNCRSGGRKAAQIRILGAKQNSQFAKPYPRIAVTGDRVGADRRHLVWPGKSRTSGHPG